VCCRHPPLLLATGAVNRSSGFVDTTFGAAFPTIQLDWWCGDYAAA